MLLVRSGRLRGRCSDGLGVQQHPEPARRRIESGADLASRLLYTTLQDGDSESRRPQMSGKKRYGDPRKTPARGSSNQARGRSKGELSVAFIFFAWIVFFVLWLAVGSLLVAAIVLGVLLLGGMAVLNAR